MEDGWMERGGVEEITCERVKGLNKRTGHRGREGRSLEEDRIQGSRARKRSERRAL